MMEKMTTTINEMKMGRKPKNKKGFTLVEIIVVLVILAILAAILIPSMVGYINKAQKKAAVAEGRSVLMAMQTEVSDTQSSTVIGANTTTLTDPQVAAVKSLAEVSGTLSTAVTVTGSKVEKFTYTTKDNWKVAYDRTADQKFEITKAK